MARNDPTAGEREISAFRRCIAVGAAVLVLALAGQAAVGESGPPACAARRPQLPDRFVAQAAPELFLAHVGGALARALVSQLRCD